MPEADTEHRKSTTEEKQEDDLATVHAAPGAAAAAAPTQPAHATATLLVLVVATEEVALGDTVCALVLVVTIKGAIRLPDLAEQLMRRFRGLLANHWYGVKTPPCLKTSPRLMATRSFLNGGRGQPSYLNTILPN